MRGKFTYRAAWRNTAHAAGALSELRDTSIAPWVSANVSAKWAQRRAIAIKANNLFRRAYRNSVTRRLGLIEGLAELIKFWNEQPDTRVAFRIRKELTAQYDAAILGK